jgi:hypothetical protein
MPSKYMDILQLSVFESVLNTSFFYCKVHVIFAIILIIFTCNSVLESIYNHIAGFKFDVNFATFQWYFCLCKS